MYTSFFGFKENPFNLTPDPRYLFLSPYHKEALDHLLYGINERKGFIAITGGIGTGKTTLCRSLLSHLDESTKTALIFNAFISDMELLETINQEFGIDMEPKAASKKGYIDVLNDFLLKTFSSGGNAVLLIDEAQNLSHPVLEQIRMISNLETEKDKLIQIVLVGQSELREHLAAYSLKQLDDRIMVRYDLKSLDFKDVQGYVDHRLVVAGGRGDLKFTRGALKEIYAHSRGNPRRINAVCDRALLIAYAREKHIISKEMVGKAIDEIRGDRRAEHGVSWKKVASSTMLLLILILVAGFGGLTFRVPIYRIFSEEQKTAVFKTRDAPSRDIKPKKEAAALFPDEKNSVARLFITGRSQTQTAKPEKAKAPETSESTAVTPEYIQPGDVTEEVQPDVASKDTQSDVTAKDAKPAEIAPAQDMGFSVQVGSFLVEKNALKLVDDLKGKEYQACILRMLDSKSRSWYVVQIASYEGFKKASTAASDFIKKEKIVAVVAPITVQLMKKCK